MPPENWTIGNESPKKLRMAAPSNSMMAGK